jgi:Flp pilus assembly protein TadG
MYYLLAQAADESAFAKIGEKISEGVSEGVAKGLEKSSENAPTNWILMFAVIAIVLIFCTFGGWALSKILTVLRQINEAQDDRDAANRVHVKEMSSDFTIRDKQARDDCHLNAKELAQLSKDATANLATATGRLEVVATKVEESAANVAKTVHDSKNIQQSVCHTLDLVLANMGKPTVAQMFTTETPLKEERQS